MKKICPLLAIVLTLATLAGCAFQRTSETIEKNNRTAESITEHVARTRAERAPSVTNATKPWVSLKPLATEPHDTRLPDAVRCKLTFAPVQPVSLLEFGQIVTQLCGIPVRVTTDALNFLSGGGASAPLASMPGNKLPPVPPLPAGAPASAGMLAGSGSVPIVPQLMVNAAERSQSGMISGIKWAARPLSGLLDVVTSRLGLSWRYANGSISIFYLDTRTFRLTAIPSTTTMRSTVTTGSTLSSSASSSSSSSSGGGNSSAAELSGGSNQSTEVALSTNIVKDVEQTIKSMLTAQGLLSMSYSTGTIAVTDTPEVLGRIGKYLEAENANLRRMVRISVDIMVVTLDAGDRFGIDWNVVYKQVAGKYGAGLMSGMSQGEGSVVSSFGILDTSGSEFSGTKLLFDALSTQGSVSVVTTPTLNTLNLQPAPLQISNQQYFVQESTAAVSTPNYITPAGLKLGVITTGFNANVLPYVIDSENLLLQFSGSISPRAKMRSVTNGQTSAEAPETSNRNFSQQVALRSGQTVVLSGYEQSSEQGDKSGVGDPGFIGLGGSVSRSVKREVLVILITPIIQEFATIMSRSNS